MKLAASWRAAGTASVMVVACAGVARADDDTSREKQLETRVNELERQLAEVNKRLAQTGTNASGGELEERVAELEKLSKKTRAA